MTYAIDNDGRYPDDSPVWVWYPPSGPKGTYNPGRDHWAWLPGSILGQCGPDEWHVVLAQIIHADGWPQCHVVEASRALGCWRRWIGCPSDVANWDGPLRPLSGAAPVRLAK